MAHDETVTTTDASRRRAMVTLIAVTVGLVAVDQASKAWAVAVMQPRIAAGEGPIPVIGDLLFFTYHENPGASFGIGTGYTWIFTAVAAGVVIAIARMSRRLASLPWAIALATLLGGALGNLIDRLFRPPGFGRGHVIDFIGFGDWFVNNVADIAISAAAVLMVLLVLRGIDIDGTRSGEHGTDAPARDGRGGA